MTKEDFEEKLIGLGYQKDELTGGFKLGILLYTPPKEVTNYKEYLIEILRSSSRYFSDLADSWEIENNLGE